MNLHKKFTGRAIVAFDTEESAEEAAKLNGIEMDGKALSISVYQPQPKPEGCVTLFIGM